MLTCICFFVYSFHQIWDLSDPTGKGYLDKSGLFVALKLIALAQTGDTINMRNILNEPPNPPKVVSFYFLFRLTLIPPIILSTDFLLRVSHMIQAIQAMKMHFTWKIEQL